MKSLDSFLQLSIYFENISSGLLILFFGIAFLGFLFFVIILYREKKEEERWLKSIKDIDVDGSVRSEASSKHSNQEYQYNENIAKLSEQDDALLDPIRASPTYDGRYYRDAFLTSVTFSNFERKFIKVHTHYDNLKVPREASYEIIRASYKLLSQRYHPDKNKSPKSEKVMKLINKAWSVLSDPEQRKQHDEWINISEHQLNDQNNQ
jgi:hypothetical protein